ncbi:hypothetical protein QE369_001518 [Agrobacterium larrymoorei]|uniref:Uncharacterized protein n=1 Tax=Agrobacterium larrymoorei TaxID=160699 RepID=A0AAJ2B8F2_9HYPH|nr:hypothetical protein [Agrobacterium larrymoorei]MDR6101340.1 hypothetical protein [Agrobacterium larrymoorei]
MNSTSAAPLARYAAFYIGVINSIRQRNLSAVRLGTKL